MKRTILLIVVVCALAARWAHHVHDEKIMELEAALQMLWGLPDQRVEIRGSAIIVDANMPATPTPPPARWNYDYLRFVSRLRGFGELGEISVNGHREIGSLTPRCPSARLDGTHPASYYNVSCRSGSTKQLAPVTALRW